MKKRIDNFLRNGVLVFLQRYLLLVCFAIVMIVWSFRLLDLQYRSINLPSTYTSDAIAQQVILHDWQEGYRESAMMGEDSWFMKFPLYIVSNNLPVSSVKKLFITSEVILAITLLLVLISIQRFLKSLNVSEKRRKLALMASSMFLAAVPTTTFFVFQFPNSRNIEIGLFLLILVELYRYFVFKNAYKTHKRLKTSGLVLLSAVLFANDPLFLYLFAIPTALFCCGYLIFCNKSHDVKIRSLLVMTLLSIVLSKALAYILSVVLPIKYIIHNSKFATFDVFIVNLKVFFNNAINIFGVNFWGNKYASTGTLKAFLFICLLMISIYGIITMAKKYKSVPSSGLIAFLAVFTIVVFLVGTDFSIGTNSLSGRFLILLVPIEILGLVYALAYLKNLRIVAVVLLCLLAVFTQTLASTGRAVIQNRHARVNAIDAVPLQVITENNLTKGYAPYSRSATLTYSSNFNVHVISSECSLQDKQMYFSPVLTEKANLNRASDKSFYIYDSLRPYDCKPEDLLTLLGTPEKTIPLPMGEVLNIYNYDITPKIKR